MASKIKLKVAIARYQEMPGAVSNSYGWYRNSANKYGSVSIGEIEIKAFKAAGNWWLDLKDFERAIKNAEEYRKELIKATKDISRGLIRGKDGETIEFDGGRYTVHGGFRFETSHYELYRRRSEGDWYCNKCNKAANVNGNTVSCSKCGTTFEIHDINRI